MFLVLDTRLDTDALAGCGAYQGKVLEQKVFVLLNVSGEAAYNEVRRWHNVLIFGLIVFLEIYFAAGV